MPPIWNFGTWWQTPPMLGSRQNPFTHGNLRFDRLWSKATPKFTLGKKIHFPSDLPGIKASTKEQLSDLFWQPCINEKQCIMMHPWRTSANKFLWFNNVFFWLKSAKNRSFCHGQIQEQAAAGGYSPCAKFCISRALATSVTSATNVAWLLQ